MKKVTNFLKNCYSGTNLRTLLVFPFVCQILAILMIISYLSYHSAKRALNEITNDLRREISFKIETYLKDYFEEANQVNTINYNQIKLNPSLVNDLPILVRYFAYQYQWTDNIDKIAFATEKEGNFIEIYRNNQGKLELKILDRKQSNNLYTYQINEEGKILNLVNIEKNTKFDPRQLFWYQDTVNHGVKSWHQKDQHNDDVTLMIFNSKPVYDRDNKLIGVLTNHLSLRDINTFLSSLKIGKTGNAFIFDRQRLLIANSLNNYQNYVNYINQLHDILNKNNIFINDNKKYQEFRLNFNNQPFLLQIINFKNDLGIDWLIVLLIPESDFMRYILENTRVTIIISCVALLFAISSGIITSKLIIKPIINLKTASYHISQGKFSHKVPLQGIQELDTLAESFNHMSEMLEAFFDDLNKSLQEVSNLKYAIDQSAIVTITEPTGKIIYCNEKLSEITGYSKQELIGEKTNKLKSGYHHEDFYRQMWLTIGQGYVWRGEIKNKKKNNHYYWVDTTIVPLTDEKGNIIQYLSIQTEITDRKLLEKNLEKIVEIRTQELAKANHEISLLNQRLCSENMMMSGKLKILHQMQQLILPKTEELKQIKCLDIACYMEPMDELGGDYYDVLVLDDIITIGIGDVAGHGLESGVLMVMTQAAICTLKQQGEKNPVNFLDTLNKAIYHNIQRMKSEKNLSLAILNYADNKISISGQHEEIILVRKGGKIELIDTIDLGLPIGLDYDIKEFINHKIIELNSGDGIVLYTDGITEARNINKHQYGINRLCNVVSQIWHLEVENIKNTIVDDVKKFIGLNKISDDITLLILKQK